MLMYASRGFIRSAKLIIGCFIAILIFNTTSTLFRHDIAVTRYPPQHIPQYQCPHFGASGASGASGNPIPRPETNLTEPRALLLLESAYSKHGKLLRQLYNSLKYPYKWETFAKNVPLLTTASHGRYSMVIVENYYKYLNMPKWNRQLLDKYLVEYQVPLISFMNTRPNDTYQRAQIKDSSIYFRQNQTVSSLRCEKSGLNRIAKTSIDYESPPSEWVLFEENAKLKTLVSAATDSGRRFSAVIQDRGSEDGVHRVLYGHNITNWVIKMNLLDVLWYYSAGQIGFSLDRFIQIDIDDIFVGARGTRMTALDVTELLSSQLRIKQQISNFTYTLGFSGSYFLNGDDNEDAGDQKLIELASNFVWFPHMWRHNHAHEHNGSYLEAIMIQNKMFAENMRLPVPFSYAIAPQHDGVYPVHEELFDAWKRVWNVTVTATEEYPHFKPASDRRGFSHKNISVLPRQTCGLYTHTQFFHNYPGGVQKLIQSIEGGDLFLTILLNPISVFMTHQQNFAHDRLAIYTFESILNFVKCNTNLNLRWQDPVSNANLYFEMFPVEKTPIWSNPCTDPRHRQIVPPSINCTTLVLPKLLVVGPQKTGSSALGSFLSLHPNVSTNPPIPGSFEEMQFFGAANYQRGVEWYASNFKEAHTVFEKSATYFDNTFAAEQIASLIPTADIVVILYDPAKRAYSWYQHLLAHNDSVALTAGSLEAILDGETVQLKRIRQRCLSGGRYTHHLDRWFDLFPASQMHLVDGELLKESPAKVLTNLSNEIGLPEFDFQRAIRYSPSKGYYCQLIDGKTHCLGGGKGRHYPPMSSNLQNKLNKLFQSDNISLHKFLVKNKLRVPLWLSTLLEITT